MHLASLRMFLDPITSRTFPTRNRDNLFHEVYKETLLVNNTFELIPLTIVQHQHQQLSPLVHDAKSKCHVRTPLRYFHFSHTFSRQLVASKRKLLAGFAREKNLLINLLHANVFEKRGHDSELLENWWEKAHRWDVICFPSCFQRYKISKHHF